MERVFAGFDQEVGEEDEAWRGVNLGTYGTGDQTPLVVDPCGGKRTLNDPRLPNTWTW